MGKRNPNETPAPEWGMGQLSEDELNKPAEPKRATFEAAMHRVLGGALALAEQRGQEYADSWEASNLSTYFVRNALDTIQSRPKEDGMIRVDFNALRILIAAALCDVKISRMTGPYKDDTCDDLINYTAFFRDLMHQYTTDG